MKSVVAIMILFAIVITSTVVQAIGNECDNKTLSIAENLISLVPAENLVQNPGFSGTEDNITNWNFHRSEAALVYPVVPGNIYGTSERSVQITYNDIDRGNTYIYQYVNIDPTQTYIFSGWAKASNVTGSGINIEIDWLTAPYDKGGSYISSSAAVWGQKGSSDWRSFVTTIIPEVNGIGQIPPNATVAAIYLSMRGDGTGTVQFDDIALSIPKSTYIYDKKEVQGYYSTWNNPNEYLNLDYSALTAIIYHHIDIKGDGSLDKSSGIYDPTPLISYAHARGVKVILGFMQSSSNDTDSFLANSSNQTKAIDNLLAEVQKYGFDGVDNDLENNNIINTITGTSNRDLLTIFQKNLYDKFKANAPINGSIVSNYRISIAVGTVFNHQGGINDIWNIPVIQNYTDYIMTMGYDWLGTNAGPNSPNLLSKDEDNGNYNSLKHFELLMNKTKILFGVPWYGYKTHTADDTKLAPIINKEIDYIPYKDYIRIVNTNIGVRIWDSLWQTPWYIYRAELLENQGFEIGIYQWSPYQTGINATFLYINPGNPYGQNGTDGNSVSIAYTDPEFGKKAFFEQMVKISPNKTYRFSAYIKTLNVSDVNLEIDWFDSAGTYISNSYVIYRQTGTINWTKFSKTLYTGVDVPYNATIAKIYLLLNEGPGIVWFDDIVFDSIPTSGLFWRQIQYDDIQSLSQKYDLVNSEGLGGIGIWQLGDGSNRSELWQLIKDKFNCDYE